MSYKMAEEFETKPMNVKSEEQFQTFAEELLKSWDEYKKLKSSMELLDATVKKYMVDKNMPSYENKYGALCVVSQNRRVLDRALIEYIEKYKVDTEFKIMYKSTKKI